MMAEVGVAVVVEEMSKFGVVSGRVRQKTTVTVVDACDSGRRFVGALENEYRADRVLLFYAVKMMSVAKRNE